MSAQIQVTGTIASVEPIKYFDSGKSVLKFSIVTPNGEAKKEGDLYAPSQFYKVELWDKMAKSMEKHIIKGSKAYVRGNHVSRAWETETAKGVEEQIKYAIVEPFTWVNDSDDSSQEATATHTTAKAAPVESPDDNTIPF